MLASFALRSLKSLATYRKSTQTKKFQFRLSCAEWFIDSKYSKNSSNHAPLYTQQRGLTGHCSIETMTFPASFACQGKGPPSNQFTHFNASKSDWSISCAASSRDLQWVYVLRMKLREELLILKTFTLHIIHPATMLKVSSPLDAV